MKKIALLAFTLSSYLFSAQENYTIKMNLKVEGLPAEYAAYGEQDFVTWVKGEKTKTEMTSMMGSNVSYYDGKSLIALSDMMGNKSGYKATKEEMEKMGGAENKDAKPSIEYTTEKRTIAGYECTKAIVKSMDKNKKETVILVWTTDKLKPMPAEIRKGRGGSFDLGDIKGQPLAIETTANNNGMEMKIKMAATEVTTTEINDSVFVPNTDGYQMMTYKDYMDKMKAMGGGK